MRKAFKITERVPWTAKETASELHVQLGHLATAILDRNSLYCESKELGRRPFTVADELADILFQLLVLATFLSCTDEDLSHVVAAPRPSAANECVLPLALCAIAGQISESLMRIERVRFPMLRAKEYGGEAGFLRDRCGKAIGIVICMFQLEGIDVCASMASMFNDARRFLATYEVRSAETIASQYRFDLLSGTLFSPLR